MIVTLVKPFSSMLKLKDVDIYDNVFSMHTKFTVVLLLVFSILVSSHEFFGKPINCIIGVSDSAMQAFAENNCWIYGTFTNRNVSKLIDGHKTWQKLPEHQKYYQWITVVLILQAILFRIPAYLWKGWECGRMKELCSGLASPVLSKDYQDQKTKIVDYLKTDHSRLHVFYILRYVMCEVMNFLIVVINMFFLNVLFNQFWIRYLPAVSALFTTEGEMFSKLANDIFPKLAKCTYSYTGPSGSEQIRDAYCLLPLNILNEKIFAFLYIWLIVLLIVSGCNLIYRSLTMVSSTIRLTLIRSLAMSPIPLTKCEMEVSLRDNNGDWFVLFQLGRNLNTIIFREILKDVVNDRCKLLNNDKMKHDALNGIPRSVTV